MDPSQLDAASLILGALAAGAGDGVKDLTKSTVVQSAKGVGHGLQSAWVRLVALLHARFLSDEDKNADLNVYIRRPTSENAEVLRSHILEDDLDRDESIVGAARKFLEEAGPAALGAGSVASNVLTQINKDGGMGFVGGVHTHNHGARISADHVSWDVTWIRGQVYELRNIGNASAYDVRVTASHYARFDPPEEESIWTAGSVREMFLAGSMQTGRPVLTVDWRESRGGPWKTWTRPIPR